MSEFMAFLGCLRFSTTTKAKKEKRKIFGANFKAFQAFNIKLNKFFDSVTLAFSWGDGGDYCSVHHNCT